MGAQEAEIIKEYDVMFAVRTGVTILIPKLVAFDCGVETRIVFQVSPENPQDVLITALDKTAVLKDLRKDYLDEAIERKLIMFYEMTDDEVVRCTPCSYAGESAP